MDVHIFWDQHAPEGLAGPVQRCIEGITGLRAEVIESPVVLNGYIGHRKQVDACAVLDSIGTFSRLHALHSAVLLVIGQDLFAPGLDFVFGLARPQTRVSVVSSVRLDNGYYGRDRNDEDLTDRISKEGSHEIGHIYGLSHCNNHECIMYNPHTLDELDGKLKEFCPVCMKALENGEKILRT
jgi:archaemetzincin